MIFLLTLTGGVFVSQNVSAEDDEDEDEYEEEEEEDEDEEEGEDEQVQVEETVPTQTTIIKQVIIPDIVVTDDNENGIVDAVEELFYQ